MELAQKHLDHFPTIKDNVERAQQYWQKNAKRFNDGKKFLYYTTLGETERTVLDEIGQPKIECNMLEAFVSRLCGEFSKQEPSIVVSSEENSGESAAMVEVVEAHFRYAEHEARIRGTAEEVYKDLAGGGYSVIKIYTDYKDPMSFDQDIKWERVFDPTLTGFDPLARETDKSDGSFCCELFPKTKEEFEALYPDADLKGINYGSSTEGFRWSYSNNKDKIILLCDYYEKKKKKIKIIRLRDGSVMTQKKYEDFVQAWVDSGRVEVPPAVVEERMTTVDYVCRYRFIENQILEYEETDYPGLPLIFVDCNSVMIQESEGGAVTQVVRPYAYNAVGMQKVANVALQSIANEMQNTMQAKIMMCKEAIDPAYTKALTDPQLPNVIIHKGFLDSAGVQPGQIPLPPPTVIARTPIPPEFMQVLQFSFTGIQQILGSFQPDLNNGTDISGKAVIESATQSNNAAMPMIIGYMRALNRVAQLYLDMIPKYYVTPRSIPVMLNDGKKGYIEINGDGQPKLDYEQGAFNVKVEAGVNSEIQKSRAIQLMASLGQAFPIFAQFIGSKGLNVIIDNLDMRSIDQLKSLAKQFEQDMAKQQQQAQQMQQQAMMNDPRIMAQKNEQMKLQLTAQQNQVDNQLKAADLANTKEANDTERMKTLVQLKQSNDELAIAQTETQSRLAEKQIEAAIEAADLSHRHTKEHHELILKRDEHRMKSEAHDKAMRENNESQE